MRKNTVAATLVVATVAMFIVACKKPGVVEEKPEQPVAQTGQVPQGLPPGGGIPPPVRAVLDVDVSSRWAAVEITVAEKKPDGQIFKVEIPLGGEMEVEGTPLKIQLLGFLPDFSMGADTVGTKSLDDLNPAAKIQVNDGDEVLFTGWSFQNYPDMHSFDDPRYSVQMTRAIPVE